MQAQWWSWGESKACLKLYLVPESRISYHYWSVPITKYHTPPWVRVRFVLSRLQCFSSSENKGSCDINVSWYLEIRIIWKWDIEDSVCQWRMVLHQGCNRLRASHASITMAQMNHETQFCCYMAIWWAIISYHVNGIWLRIPGLIECPNVSLPRNIFHEPRCNQWVLLLHVWVFIYNYSWFITMSPRKA